MTGERWGFALIAGLVLVLLVSGCITGGDIEKYFNVVSLSFSDKPILNKPVTLTLTIKAFSNTGTHYSSNSSFEIILPKGFELIDGELIWTGYIGDGDVMQHNVTVKAIKEGRWEIMAWAGPSFNPKYDGDALYIIISGNTATVSRTPFLCTGTWEEVQQCMGTESTRG